MVQGLRDRDFIREVLGRYVSPDVAQRCLEDREALRLGGDVRTVSILMSDLRGFSALSERLGPETMIGLLNRYFARMVPVILDHRGTINEFIGDAILVLFGAPVERPDDAERAVRCAWAMQRTMTAFNAESRSARAARADDGDQAPRRPGRRRKHRQRGPREVRRGGPAREPRRAHRVAHRGPPGAAVTGDAGARRADRPGRAAPHGGAQGHRGAGRRPRAARRRGGGGAARPRPSPGPRPTCGFPRRVIGSRTSACWSGRIA